MKKKLILISLLLLVILVGCYFLTRSNTENFKAPGRDWKSSKKVEDYFVSNLHMSPEEASTIRSKPGVDGKVNLRINTKVTLTALVSNLAYYGFIRDEKALFYALEHTKDTTLGPQAIKVGREGTIDTNAEYRISENMTAWELADTLLNKPSGHFPFDEYNYFFMP